MTKQKYEDQKHQEPNLVETHALNRLAKVEKEQRKVYQKDHRHSFDWKQLIMMILMFIILVVMLYSIF